MKKFNLEEALAGKPVVTRDGRKVGQLVHFKGVDSEYTVYATVNHEIETFTEDGHYSRLGHEAVYDLFMESAKREGWVNIYDTAKSGQGYWNKTEDLTKGSLNGVHGSNHVYNTEATAIEAAGRGRIATVHVEWEE